MSQYELRLVPQEEINRPMLWSLRDLIGKAADHNYGEMSVDDYIDSLMSGAMQLWLDEHKMSKIPRGIGVTRLEEMESGKKIARVILYSNESTGSYLSAAQTFEDWCLRFGADEIEFWGREGWKRALAPMGYKPKYVVMRRIPGEPL